VGTVGGDSAVRETEVAPFGDGSASENVLRGVPRQRGGESRGIGIAQVMSSMRRQASRRASVPGHPSMIEAEHRVEAVTALEGGSGLHLVLGVDLDQGGVDRVTMARQAVATEATGPNSSACSFNAAMSARQSAPSAMATARWVSTTPGSWVCQSIPHSVMATDMAPVNPTRSDNSAKSAAPACDTRFLPSGITSARRTDRLRCTDKEPSSWFEMVVVVTTILPGRRAFYAECAQQVGVERHGRRSAMT